MKSLTKICLIMVTSVLITPHALAKKGDSASATIVWKGRVPTANCMNDPLINTTSLAEIEAKCSGDFKVLPKAEGQKAREAGSAAKSAMVRFNI